MDAIHANAEYLKMKKQKTDKITKKMSFTEIMEKHPEAAEVLFAKGMHCIGCPMAMSESLGEGCLAHGLNPDEIVDELNKKLNKKKSIEK